MLHRATGDGAGRRAVPSPAFVRRLGEAGCGPEDGRVGALDLLARSGFPVPEGFVLTTEGHREFLRSPARGWEAVTGGTPTLGETLEREIRAALLDLGARTVVVGWGQHGVRRGLGTIPAVISAVREAWAPAVSLEREVPGYAGGEVPAWPVLVQRQARPAYTGWTSTAGLLPGGPARGGVPLHDVKPASGPGGVSGLTRRAAGVLGGSVRLDWGLEDGRWLLVSVEEGPDRLS